MMMMMMMMMQSEQKINSLISNLWRKGGKKRGALWHQLGSPVLGDAAVIVEKWNRRCSAQLPVTSGCLAQVSWTETRLTPTAVPGKKKQNKTKKENKATLLTICSVISTTGTKVPPCLPRAGGVRSVMVVQLCVCVWGGEYGSSLFVELS